MKGRFKERRKMCVWEGKKNDALKKKKKKGAGLLPVEILGKKYIVIHNYEEVTDVIILWCYHNESFVCDE